MKRLLIFCVFLLLAAPAQAKDRDDRLFGFLPPPPPLPGMSKDRQSTPPPLPGMSRDRQQQVIDRYYRDSERQHDEYRHYDEDDDHGRYKHKKGRKSKHLPPGLQKKAARGKDLPPGWRKKIARGEVLDRDLRPHCQDLPRDLRADLPRPPKGTRFMRLEDKIIRVVESTFEIVDVFTLGR